MISAILLIGLFLSIFPPWLTAATVEDIVVKAIKDSQRQIVDGCGLACEGCGVKEMKKVSFGYYADIEYACGLIPADLPEYHNKTRLFISFLGTVHHVSGGQIPNLE